MVAQNQEPGSLVNLFAGAPADAQRGLTGAEIAVAYKAALSDFVGRKTTRAAIAEVSRLLGGALAARKQELQEANGMSGHLVPNYF